MTVRVLHVVTSMSRGGLEVWLMHVLRNIDRTKYHFDFLVQNPLNCHFDHEIRSLGSQVIRCPRGKNPLGFARGYMKAVKTHGPYDIVHTHLHHFSGVIALLSRLAGVRQIVAHSHNAIYGNRHELSLPKRAYLRLTEWLIRRFVAFGIGCSPLAGEDLFQKDWQDGSRHRVLYCGLDFAPFRQSSGPPALEGVPPAAHTIIHVGRFTPQKNHDFLIDVIAELEKRRKDYRVLLIGYGELHEQMKTKAERLGLSQRVFFLHERNDVAELLKASDVFLFPSLFEGLGLALIEAQAAGLRCLMSDVIPAEASVLPGAIVSLPLQAGAHRWATVLDEMLTAPGLDRRGALEYMQGSHFSVDASVRELSAIYNRLASPAVGGRA